MRKEIQRNNSSTQTGEDTISKESSFSVSFLHLCRMSAELKVEHDVNRPISPSDISVVMATEYKLDVMELRLLAFVSCSTCL